MKKTDFKILFYAIYDNSPHYLQSFYSNYFNYINNNYEFEDITYVDEPVLPEGIKIFYQRQIDAPEERYRKIEKVIEDTKKEETFSDMLIRLAREKLLTGPQLYKNCGIDGRHYSKIISDRYYKPKKDTVYALAIGLKLDLDTCKLFMAKAGFAFNHSDIFDMTIRFFIESKYYDRLDIDSLMQDFNLPLLPQNW